MFVGEGNVQSWEMPRCVRYRLVPTVTSEPAIRGMAEAIRSTQRDRQIDDYFCPDDCWSPESVRPAARLTHTSFNLRVVTSWIVVIHQAHQGLMLYGASKRNCKYANSKLFLWQNNRQCSIWQ